MQNDWSPPIDRDCESEKRRGEKGDVSILENGQVHILRAEMTLYLEETKAAKPRSPTIRPEPVQILGAPNTSRIRIDSPRMLLRPRLAPR